MLVECPKCHLSQPEDQYCARCGVDMLRFKKPETSVLQKTFRSGVFQFFVVFVLGLGISYFVIETNQPQQWVQRINRFKVFSSHSSTATIKTNSQQSTSVEKKLDQPNAIKDQTAPPIEESHQTVEIQSDPKKLEGFAKAAPPTDINNINPVIKGDPDSASPQTMVKNKITFAEISHDNYVQIINSIPADKIMSAEGDLKLIRAKEVISLFQNQLKVIKYDNVFARANSPAHLWVGQGLKNNPDAAGIEIVIKGEFDNKKPATSEISFDQILDANPTHLLTLNIDRSDTTSALILARNLIKDFEFKPQLQNMPPFTVFKSTDYKNQMTELVIIIEPN